MACQLLPLPPNTRALSSPVTPAQGAYAHDLLFNKHIPNPKAYPLGYYEVRTDLGPTPIVGFLCRHTICNGVPGCCDAVTLLDYTGPLPAPPTPEPAKTGLVPPPESIDWQVVGVTAALAAGVVGAFWLALRHAGRRR